jgi:hypothetical protein
MDTYGVEAGRACIIKEITNIFGVYVPVQRLSNI